MFQTCPITSVADHGLGSRFGSSRGGGSTAAAFLGGRGHLVRSQRWLGCVQLKDCDIGSLWGWEANRGEYVFEFLAGPTRADPLLRLPHTDDVQGSVADRAVMAQLPGASRAPAAHDQRMRPVVRLPQLAHVAVEAGNQHDGHSLPPNAPWPRANCRRPGVVPLQDPLRAGSPRRRSRWATVLAAVEHLLAKEVAAPAGPAAAQVNSIVSCSVNDRESPWVTLLTGTRRARLISSGLVRSSDP